MFNFIVLLSIIDFVYGNPKQESNNYNDMIAKLQQILYQIYIGFLFIIILILSLFCISIYYRQSNETESSKIIKKTKSKSIVNKKTLKERLNNLPQFTPLLPVTLCIMQSTKNQTILDTLMEHVTHTTLFTMSTPVDLPDINGISFNFGFIEESRIMIFTIDYCHNTDKNTPFSWTLEYFFMHLLQPSVKIFTWGNHLPQLKSLERFGLFTLDDINRNNFIDIQKTFTPWYNNLFGHAITCKQYLKYDEIDGPFCSCPHRPCKYSSMQWSLQRAIMYTFNERFSDRPHGVAQCLAIAKLNHAIEKVETLQELKQLK